MSVQAFITSGILERYAFGMVSEEEAMEVKEMASQHTEIREELADIRRAIKGYLLQYQVDVPSGLKEKMKQGLRESTPVTSKSHADLRTARTVQTGSVKTSKSKSSPVAAIVSVLLGLLLIAAASAAYHFYQEAEQSKADIADLQGQVDVAQQEIEAGENARELLQYEIDMLRHEGVLPILLKGTRLAPDAKAVIYWNGAEKTTRLDVKRLPEVPEDKMLVAWVNENRTPRNLGQLLPPVDNVLGSLPFIEDPEVFYVTLENKDENIVRPDRQSVMMVGNLP